MKNISGMFVYKQTATQQHENVEEPFTNLFKNIMPSQLVEIGTASGGLTILLRDILDSIGLQSTTIRTYDVHNNNYIKYRTSEDAKIEIITKNIFNHMYNNLLEEERTEVVDFIQRDGTTIVLCDGGSKKNEFNIFAQALKPGDIIMAHDYAPSHEYFTQNILNQVWNWHEISDSDIDPVCDVNNLISYMREEFINVVWTCKQKV